MPIWITAFAKNEYIYFQYSKCVCNVSKSICGHTLCTVHTQTFTIYIDSTLIWWSRAQCNAMLLRQKEMFAVWLVSFWKCLKYHLICLLEQSWRIWNSKTMAASARFLAWAKQTHFFFFHLISLLLLTKVTTIVHFDFEYQQYLWFWC